MNEYLNTTKDLAPFIPLAKPLIETIFAPKLEELKEYLRKRKTDKKVFEHRIYKDSFQEYLCRTIYKCSIMDTLIFPNQQIHIEDIYQPLTISIIKNGNQEKYNITDFPEKLFKTYSRILVSDNAGMGKSTLSKFIALNAIKNKKQIPIHIELRKIGVDNTIIDEFLNQLNPIDEVFDKDFVFQLLKSGEFLIILDGYDEIANENQRKVTENIKEFISKCNKNYFLLTSRPEGSITTFGEFQHSNISGLKREEAYELLKKYDGISKTNLSESLIKEIQGVHQQIKDFLSNPFLVSLLYKTYSFKRDIPSRKSTFYNEVYTALYQDHDLSKDAYKRDKNSKLDIQDFRLVLREFSIFTAKKSEIEYTKIDAIEYISECKKKLPFLKFKESNFVEDLLTTVPIFIREGANIKWSHKSIQDYFAAEYITYQPNKKDIVNHLIKNNIRKYWNILDLVIELDPNLIRHYVLPEILEDLIKHFENKYQFEHIEHNELELRKTLTFGTTFWYNKSKILDPELKPDTNKEDEFSRVKNYIKEKYDLKYDTAVQYANMFFLAAKNSNKNLFIQLVGSKGFLGKSLYKRSETKKFGVPNPNKFSTNPRIIDDNPKATYNQKSSFTDFNDVILSKMSTELRMQKYFVPNIKNCKKILKGLEEEIKEINETKYLEDF